MKGGRKEERRMKGEMTGMHCLVQDKTIKICDKTLPLLQETIDFLVDFLAFLTKNRRFSAD